MIFNYKKISTIAISSKTQLSGVFCDREYEDKLSEKDKNRPQLETMLSNLSVGDFINVHSMDKLARNTKDLLSIIEKIKQKGATIKFHKENLTFSPDKQDQYQQLMMTVLNAVSSLENSKTSENVSQVKEKGKCKTGKNKLTKEQVEELLEYYKNDVSITKIAQTYNISRPTVYSYLKSNNSCTAVIEEDIFPKELDSSDIMYTKPIPCELYNGKEIVYLEKPYKIIWHKKSKEYACLKSQNGINKLIIECNRVQDVPLICREYLIALLHVHFEVILYNNPALKYTFLVHQTGVGIASAYIPFEVGNYNADGFMVQMDWRIGFLTKEEIYFLVNLVYNENKRNPEKTICLEDTIALRSEMSDTTKYDDIMKKVFFLIKYNNKERLAKHKFLSEIIKNDIKPEGINKIENCIIKLLQSLHN